MTHIVYTGDHLYADRKVFGDNGFHFADSKKIKTYRHGSKKTVCAFSGTLAQCAIGYSVVESNFDREVILEARQRQVEDLEYFGGIVVELDPTAECVHRVFIVSYAGDKYEMLPYELLVVGAFNQAITDTIKANAYFNGNGTIIDCIRFAVRETNANQDGACIDAEPLGVELDTEELTSEKM